MRKGEVSEKETFLRGDVSSSKLIAVLDNSKSPTQVTPFPEKLTLEQKKEIVEACINLIGIVASMPPEIIDEAINRLADKEQRFVRGKK